MEPVKKYSSQQGKDIAEGSAYAEDRRHEDAVSVRRNVSEHLYADANNDDPEDTFEVYENDKGWFWSFSPVWRDAGPFRTADEAIIAGQNFLDEEGKPYIMLDDNLAE